MLFTPSLVPVLFTIIRGMDTPPLVSAARIPAAPLLHHAAQFLHLPRERPDLAVQCIDR